MAQLDGVIKGILLHQGETNNGQDLWPSYVKKIYNDMLTDLSMGADSVPLLAGEVLSADGNCCASMNLIINRLPDTIPTAYVISSSECTAKDNAHFDSKGYRKLGRRYAVQMLSLLGYEAAYAEAECGTVGDDWDVLTNQNASNTTYVTASPGAENILTAPTDASIIQMSFSVNADTSYYLYGRFNNSSTNDDSFWIKIDGGAFELHENLTTNGWEWIELASINLTAGEHIVSIAFSENGAKLDKLVIKNSQILPVGVGEEAVNLCKAEISISGGIDLTLKGYALKQNYPNPGLESNTNISFEIPDRTYVSLKVYNSQGVVIDELAGKEFNSGEHIIEFNLEKLSPGIYFYTFKTDKFSATRKMIITTK